ncbi:hypothetical protein HY989_02805 [Candidatus Micrarchaeota archaeon]|nr:hypothetical protein [Candidatus Micrarchaeota archaeon]
MAGAVKVMARCMKEKMEREMKDPKMVTMKNGMNAYKGNCVKCDCKMFKIVGKAK